MSAILETRKVRCRCGREKSHIERFAKYGWSFSSKQLLNRFGNPMPLDALISEAEKRDKCFYDLTFTREIDKEIADKLNLLQNEDDNLVLRQSCFTGKRVTACVFFTVLIITFISIYLNKTAGEKMLPVMLVLTIISAVILALLVGVGILRVIRNCRHNDEVNEKKQQIYKEAQELLNNK